MKTNLIENIHSQVGGFNGALYFTLNNRLLILEVSTPRFNDYNEWRITDITYAKDDYKPEENTVELKTLKNFAPIQLTDKEVEYLELHFTNEELEEKVYDSNVAEFKHKHSDSVTYWDYTNCPLLASIHFEGNEGLSHDIHKSHPDGDKDAIQDKYMQTKEWKNKKDITVEQGLYNILIPIMDSYVEDQTT